ncbi:MAG: hypothetical protein VYD55_02100 [Chloroflexota bacterium]|nr:hypothetical protein [Chloroflexota bacterium]
MYYDTTPYKSPIPVVRDDRTHALVNILPREGKRLIARGVLALPEVKRALENGWFVVSRGITPSYILEELTGQDYDTANCTAGIVTEGRMASVLEDDRLGPWVFKDGTLDETPAPVVLDQFTAYDVSVKGANAVDPDGNIGVFAADKAGGTVGGIWPTITARGAHWVAPVSLERLIPSVIEAARHCGNHLWDYTMGQSAGFMPVVNALVVTEIQAIELLTGVTAVHVGSGGVAGSEGAVILALEGEHDVVLKAFELIEAIKGEPQFDPPRLVPYIREPENSPSR